MSIRSLQMDFTGRIGVNPRLGSMITTDSLETITTAGYLNSNSASFPANFLNTDLLFVAYNYNDKTGTADTAMFSVSVTTGGVVTLSVSDANTPEYVQDITPGVSQDEKAIVLDDDGEIDGVVFTDISAAGTYVAALSATSAETNLNHLQPASVALVSTTPASGTCAVQLQVRNAAAGSLAAVTPILAYISTSTGVLSTAVTSLVTLTNGAITQLVTGQVALCTSNNSGQIGITVTASAGSYYLSFVLPNGKVVTTTAIVVNA